MAYDETTADRIRHMIVDMNLPDITEKKMFGGLSFLYKGKMTVGVVKEDLAVRVVSDKEADWLEQPYIRPMDFTKRPMKEFLFVEPDGFKTDPQLREFILLGVEHAKTKI